MRHVRTAAIATQSGASSINSAPMDANQLIALSLQAVSTGTLVGSVKFQFSNDQGFPAVPAVPQNWTDIPSASVSIAGAGAVGLPKMDSCYQWVRVVYTFTSGAGNISVNVNALSM